MCLYMLLLIIFDKGGNVYVLSAAVQILSLLTYIYKYKFSVICMSAFFFLSQRQRLIASQCLVCIKQSPCLCYSCFPTFCLCVSICVPVLQVD